MSSAYLNVIQRPEMNQWDGQPESSNVIRALTDTEVQILEVCWRCNFFSDSNIENISALVNCTREEVTSWRAEKNRKVRLNEEEPYKDRELKAAEQRLILERAWEQGVLSTSANYTLISELSQKTRKQVRDWCAQKRRKIRLSKEGTNEHKKRVARKRKRECESKCETGSSFILKKFCRDFGVESETLTLLDNAWDTGLLSKVDTFNLVAILANVSIDALKKFVEVKYQLAPPPPTLLPRHLATYQ